MWLGIDLQISSLKLRDREDVWLTVNLITISVYVCTSAPMHWSPTFRLSDHIQGHILSLSILPGLTLSTLQSFLSWLMSVECHSRQPPNVADLQGH
ncbi:hypothetical protein JOM56_011199 [Amanita muscaria]